MNAVTLVRSWSKLPAPSLEQVTGDLRAEFVPPLRHVAPVGLGLLGLPRWHGKRFWRAGGHLAGVNLLRPHGGAVPPADLVERLAMTAQLAHGVADGRPAVVITYESSAPRPWRWVRDEVRQGDGVLVGMSYLERGPLRRLGMPFLLHPEV